MSRYSWFTHTKPHSLWCDVCKQTAVKTGDRFVKDDGRVICKACAGSEEEEQDDAPRS